MRDLTLRTPTLDDVFLELTGSHIEREDTQRGDRPMSAADVVAPIAAETPSGPDPRASSTT